MKIDLNFIPEDFVKKPGFIGHEPVVLIYPPHIAAKWDKNNLHFRSSIWNMQGELVSAGFRKFFNLGEHPEITPIPTNLKNVNIPEKLDGSLVIVSRYKGEYIFRTRGVYNLFEHDNGHEFNEILEKYPQIKTLETGETWNHSYLFEWLTPNRPIVIRYPENDIILLGIIRHDNYILWYQEEVDLFASLNGFKRPKFYHFDTIEDLVKSVEAFKGVEGVLLYFNEDQDLLKVKGLSYLASHRMKSELASLDRVLDLYMVLGEPSYQEYYEYILSNFDFELAESSRGFVSKVCEGKKEVDAILNGMVEFIKKNTLSKDNRKQAAQLILGSYGKETNRSSFVFQMLDGKIVDQDGRKKLYYQVLKK